MFGSYRPLEGVFDEIFSPRGVARSGLAEVVRELNSLGTTEIKTRQRLANNAFLRAGITFRVYSDQRGVEKIFPFDLVPRAVSAKRWERLERGLLQRVEALDLFLADLYGDQRILKDGVLPRELVEGSQGFLPELRGIRPPGGVYVHVAGIDLVRDPSGEFLVLEDNLRTPSGVSYVLANRQVMKRVFPQLFGRVRVRAVDDYPSELREGLRSLSDGQRLVVLTPGQYNSAYYEHSFLARRMGCELVQGSDLFVEDDRVFVHTTRGPEPVDVVYRRVDDDFLDPEVFRPDSLLGVPGIVRAYAKGNVVLANALGNGVADDKAIYPLVPAIVKYYLGADPLLGQVETYQCSNPSELSHVLANLERMVVKSVNESGGYGMLFGPRATRQERSDFARKLNHDPRNYIAQPVVELSTCPTWSRNGPAPRRVDLRPYIVSGKKRWVLPGGLTRVALVEGSYVVNSSQGGGSKDTWVLADGGDSNAEESL